MPEPEVLAFTPVPVRGRRDGWSSALQRRFVLLLARGASVGEAARSLGRSRQTAYVLRKRAGAEDFAAAWDAAIAFAGRVRAAARPVADWRFGMNTILVPRFYRGRLVGFVQREDDRAALRLPGRLDRLAMRLDKADALEKLRPWAEAADALIGPEADKADAMALASGSTLSAFAAKRTPC